MKNETVYQIPIQTARSIKRTVFERPKMGCECMFIRVTPKVGIKMYPTRSEANFSYRGQKKAAKHGIGPKVFSAVRKCLFNLGQYDRDGIFSNNQIYGYFYKTEVADKPGRIRDDEEDKLCGIMDHIRLSTLDATGDNLGRIKGRLVCIDFGRLSTTH